MKKRTDKKKKGAKEGGRLLTEYACGLIAFENNKAYGFTCRYFGAEPFSYPSFPYDKDKVQYLKDLLVLMIVADSRRNASQEVVSFP